MFTAAKETDLASSSRRERHSIAPAGAVCVTPEDIPGHNGIQILDDTWPVLASEFVNHVGEPVALVAALPPTALARVFILFPDPWPKTRHHKRRIVQRETPMRLAVNYKPTPYYPQYQPRRYDPTCLRR